MVRHPRSSRRSKLLSFEHLSNLALGVAGLVLLLDSYRTKSRIERLGGLLALANVAYGYADQKLPGLKGKALSGFRVAKRLLGPLTSAKIPRKPVS